MNIIKPSIELIDPPEYEEMKKKIERIGRVCYKSESKIAEGSADAFISRIVESGHGSVIEHAIISVKVICDRGVSHEIVRHRIASYSQESTRYCNYAKEKFNNEISCIDIRTGFGYDMTKPEDVCRFEAWKTAMEQAEKSYFAMLAAGAKPEEARSVLPNSLKTEIVISMNLREWRHFITLRGSRRAHPQIREITRLILTEFTRRYPLFFRDLSIEE